MEWNSIILLSAFVGVAFIFYGISCFKSKHIKSEFERYGLPHRRVLTGVLQLLGGIGLLAGMYLSPILAAIASIGLSILMFLGFSVRLKIKDNIIQSAPSLIFAILNLIIFIYFCRLIE